MIKYIKRLTERDNKGYKLNIHDVIKTDFGSKCSWSINKNPRTIRGYAVNKLAYYENLDEKGRLLKLPCTLGDTVYTNVSMQGWYFRKENRPYEAKVVFIGINGIDNLINVDFENGLMLQFKFSEIGKNVFLTKEEAEATLQKMKETGE